MASTPSKSDQSPQPPLIPDIYCVACVPVAGKAATLYLHHPNADQAVVVKPEVEDLPAQEWVFTAKPDEPTKFSIYSIQSGQYIGIVNGQVKSLSKLFWWELVQDGA
ncbi:hypothetical protein FRC01_014767, partial [Tulasnella sp. 417]